MIDADAVVEGLSDSLELSLGDSLIEEVGLGDSLTEVEPLGVCEAVTLTLLEALSDTDSVILADPDGDSETLGEGVVVGSATSISHTNRQILS